MSQQMLLNSVVIAFLAAGLTWLATRYWTNRAAAVRTAELLAAEQRKVADTVAELSSQLSILKQAVVPISTAFQAILIKELTHLHTPEMDKLMVRLGPPYRLTSDEEARLTQLLDERSKELGDAVPESERDAATMLPLIMKRAKTEAEALADAPTQLQVVTVAPDADAPVEAPVQGQETPRNEGKAR